MNVESVMVKNVKACEPHHPLSCAASLMWENDIGCVPIVDEKGKAIAVITDRDICMACLTKGKPPQEIPIRDAMSRNFHAVRPRDDLQTARDLMRKQQVRRLPVINDSGRLMGMLSLNDLARMSATGQKDDATRPESIAATLARVGAPRATGAQA